MPKVSSTKSKGKDTISKNRTTILTKTIEKNVGNDTQYSTPDSTISVITKTRTPKTIIQSEHINSECNEKYSPNSLIKFVCIFIMCVIILITFFLSLKTYNILNSLVIG